MTIYGPDRYKKYVFYDGKSVARSPLSNKTSTFDERDPKSYKSHRVLPSEKKTTLATLERNDHLRSRSEQKACVLRWKTCCTFAPLEQNVHFRPRQPQKSSFCTRGTNVFFWTFAPLEQNITFWPEVGPIQQNSRFTREVGRFFVQPSKTPNITDENTSKGVQKGNSTHHTWQRPDLFWTLKSQYYTGNHDGKLISGRLPNKKKRPRTVKIHKNASPARKKQKITK